MVPGELFKDVNASRVTDQDLTIFTLDQKQCFDRLQLASLRELGSRLGMPRLALKALEACAQLERHFDVNLGWRFEESPTGVCFVCSLLQPGGLGLECVHEKGTPACPYQRLL